MEPDRRCDVRNGYRYLGQLIDINFNLGGLTKNHSMKRTLLTTLIFLLPMIAFGQLKVGTMNPDDVLNAIPETAEVETQIQEYIQERQNAYQTRYQQWITDLTNYSERVENGEISDSERASEEERLADEQAEIENFQTRIQQQIQQRQNDLFNPLLARVENAMAEVSEEMGLEYVINKTASTGDPIVYYSSQRGVDITERVIQKLTQN